MSFSPNFKAIPYTASERAELAVARAFEEEEDIPDLEWTASNGQHVQIFRDSSGFTLKLDGKESFNNVIGPVPAQLAEIAAKHGVVAMLGPVGLNAERRALVEGLRKWGQK